MISSTAIVFAKVENRKGARKLKPASSKLFGPSSSLSDLIRASVGMTCRILISYLFESDNVWMPQGSMIYNLSLNILINLKPRDNKSCSMIGN